MQKNVHALLIIFLAFGWTAVYPEKAEAKTEAFMIKHLSGPLVSIDTLRKIIVVEEKSIDYVVTMDSSTLAIGPAGVIMLTSLNLNDSVSVEYRKYTDNKRIATQIVQKTGSRNNRAAKSDSTGKALIKLSQSKKNDTTSNAKNSPALEASKRLLEKKLSNKTREQLYHDVFNSSPPKRPKQVEASLMINETTDGAMEIIFTDDHLDFSMPALPVMKILSKIVTPELLKKVKAAVDSTGRIRQSVLISLGLQTTFDAQVYQVKIVVPSIYLLKQVHQLTGLMENPYSVETIKPNAVSAFLNIQADQKISYVQSLSNNSTTNQSLASENSDKKFSRPFMGNFDGAVNAKGVVLEGMANYQEYQNRPFQRKDVRLLYDRPEQALRFSAGDIQYLTLGYQSSVRMGGVSISKDYSLQPYILTYPVGDHEFYLTDPAEAEIWVDEVLVKKMVLDPGTHDIRAFPFSMGNNHVKIILKDFAGRTDTIDFSFQYNTTLLTKGYSRFSFNAGFPSPIVDERYRYNQDQPCFSLAYQRGISDKLTLDLYSEAFTSEVNTRTFNSTVDTNTLFSKSYKLSHSREGMLGFGGLYATPSGFINFDAAGSYIKNRGPGSALRLGYTYETMVSYKNSEQMHPKAFRLNTPFVWNTQAEYLSPKFMRSPVDSPYNYLEALKFSTNLTVPLSEQFTISTGANYYIRRDTSNLFGLTLRLQKTWLKDLSASLTFQYTSATNGYEANPEVIASVQWMFRSNKNEFELSEEINRHPPDNLAQSTTPSQTTQTSQTSQSTIPQWDFYTGFQWNYDDFKARPERVLGTINAQLGPQNNDYNALLGYTGNQGTVELTQTLDQPENSGANYLNHRTDLLLKTALVYAGKTICFSRPIYSGGFVLVKGVKNLDGNKIKVNPSDQGYDATTNAFGPAVLPLYSPYQIKRIRVEPENPPMGFVNEKSSFTLFPQYKSGFSLELGSEKSVLVLGTVQDFDGSPFGYQSITIIAENDKKAVPILTFTNSIGRFQFLGHEKQTYKIMPPTSMERIPIAFKIPKNATGFYQAGVLTFLQTGNPTPAVKMDTVKADTAKPDTIKPDTAKTREIKPDTTKTLNDKNDTSKVPWFSVLGSLASPTGKTIASTSITISYLDPNKTEPLNKIFDSNSVTTEHGLFSFTCRKAGNYKILITSGDNKGASVSFSVPPGTIRSFNIGNLRVK